MASVKTAVSLPGPLFNQAEELAERMGLSRSRFYAVAIGSYIERYESEELLRRINDTYADERDAGEEASTAAMRKHQRDLLEGEW